jgi:hypothetical protein
MLGEMATRLWRQAIQTGDDSIIYHFSSVKRRWTANPTKNQHSMSTTALQR